MAVRSFADLGLFPESSDRDVWMKCQEEELLLITSNRNAKGADSLEEVIRTLGTSSCLPVFTIGDPRRLFRDREYAERAADRFLEDLFDMANHRGVGRIYIP
jgi:hypothetical protein